MSRLLRSLCAAALMSGTLALTALVPAGGVLVAQRIGSASRLAPVSIVASATCPSGDTCVTIPETSHHHLKGGTVVAGPTSGLGPNQWVYLNGSEFAKTTYVEIQYCSDTHPITTHTTPPICLTTPLEPNSPASYKTQTFTTGTFATSFQVAQASTKTAPLPGAVLGTPGKKGTFLCDAATPCAIDVMDQGQYDTAPPPTPQNAAVIPVTFAPSSTGCSGQQEVPTKSDFGMEFVLPIAARDSCATTSHPAVALDEAQDGYDALDSLQSGGVSVAFTDDPEATDQQSILTTGNYKLIPVALTANVVAFRALQERQQGHNIYPVFNLNLTPTMASGLLTGTYSNASDTDTMKCTNASCPGTPPCPPPLERTTPSPTCSLFTQANFSEGFQPPSTYSPFVRSDAAGSNGLFFSWVCNAPTEPVHVSIPTGTKKNPTYTATYAETTTGAQELEHGFGSPDAPVTTCPTTEQYPALPTGHYGSFLTFTDPNQQNLNMLKYAELGNSKRTAAFSTMNWAEARYYGLAVASLQNAKGQFEAPSATSLDAAVASGNPTVNSDGTLTPDYTKAETGVYPMTSVEYAAVCGNPTTTTRAAAIKSMLDELLKVTGGTTSGQLPEGFVPLPSALYTQAKTDVTQDVVGGATTSGSDSTVTTTAPLSACPILTNTTSPKTSTTSTTKTPSNPTATPSQSSTTARTSSSTPPPTGPLSRGTAPATSIRSTTLPSTTSNSPAAGASTSRVPTSGTPSSKGRVGSRTSSLPVLLLSLASSGSRVLLPLAALLALIALMFGGLLVFSPPFRRFLSLALREAGKRIWSVTTSTARASSTRRGRRTGSRRPW